MNLWDQDLQKALEILRSGGTILYPTDTVWGIGCDATNSKAVEKIYRIKKRERSKSMIILLDSEKDLDHYADMIPEVAFDLVRLSESPLTIIYPKGKNFVPDLLAEDGSIGIRITSEPFTKELIRRFRKPLVATSANLSEEATPENFSEISKAIIDSVDYVVKYRQSEKDLYKPSGIIKFFASGEFKVIRN